MGFSTKKRKYKQTVIQTFFDAPTNKRVTKVRSTETFYTYCGTIYAYYRRDDGLPVYVGQTYRTLEARDNRHLRDFSGAFDKTYTDRELYRLDELEKKTFEGEDEFDVMGRMAEWLNEREIYHIAELDTYNNGLNSTKGGQNGLLVAQTQAARKRSIAKFEEVFLPSQREFLEEFKHGNCPQGGIAGWDPPSGLMTSKQLGTLHTSIRTGNTTVPAEVKDEWLATGFHMNLILVRWKTVILPSQRELLEEFGHGNCPKRGVPGWDPPSGLMTSKQLGTLHSNIRSGQNVPAELKDEWLATGFQMDGRKGAALRKAALKKRKLKTVAT